MENSRRREICKVDVRRASMQIHLLGENQLEK